MKALFSLGAVVVLILLAYLGTGVANMDYLFGVVIPYAALIAFVGGFAYRILAWAKVPVPFRIPTTCGQAQSLDWIKQNKFDNPSTKFGVFIRMTMEVLFFRSLFRNTKMELAHTANGPKLAYGSAKWLWLFALLFHWSFFIILVRHLRLFLDTVPAAVVVLDQVDSMFKIGLPPVYITDALILAGLLFLFLRRVVIPRMKYISLAADYFPLFLLISIACTGMLMRYFIRVDIYSIKTLVVGLASLNPIVPTGISSLLYIHLFLVCVLIAYFPMSKLMHMGGVFMSPTRNMANNSRAVRHENPWNYPVHVHTYAEYEDEFRTKMVKAGIPVEKKE